MRKQASMTAKNVPRTKHACGSASKKTMLIPAIALIRLELSSEAVSGALTFHFVLVLERFDDLIYPPMCIGQSLTEDVTLEPVPLSEARQDDEPHYQGGDHTWTMRS
jgi:hypothetical protein